jgi:UDP-glucuronate 4-epimerase
MRVLVFGGTGFIGTQVCKEIALSGNFKVTSFSNEDSDLLIPGVTYYKGDILSYAEVYRIISDNDIVINLAAIMGVFASIDNPEIFIDINIKGTANILKAASKVKILRFIQASSDAIYGEYPLIDDGITEDFYPLNPPNPYAVSKMAQEHLCHSYFYTHELPIISLRFSSVYGMSQKEKNIIWTFIESASNQRAIEIFGDGSHGRDFTYVDDVAQGVVKALKKGSPNDKYHISGGSFIQINELAKLIADHFTGTKITYSPTNKNVVKQGFLNINKARVNLGYNPNVLIGIKKYKI